MTESTGSRAHPGRAARRARPDRARSRDHPRPLRVRRWILPGVLALVTVAVVMAYFTPVLGVRSVRVSGIDRLDEREVRRAAELDEGTPMLRVDDKTIERRLSGLAEVDSSDVRLVWPATVHIDITERAAEAVAPSSSGFRLVDDQGVVFAEVDKRPNNLPELRVPSVGPDSPETAAALTAYTALPRSVRDQVRALEAPSPDRVRLKLTNNRVVEWGDVASSERKAAILPPLLTRPGRVYDVTSPELPTVS